MSKELATEYPGTRLNSATVCDARSIPRPDKSADAILLMGPLYSITEYEERILAIKESHRLLKEDGLLFSAALTLTASWFPASPYTMRMTGKSGVS